MNNEIIKFIKQTLLFSIFSIIAILILNNIYLNFLQNQKNIYKSYSQFSNFDKNNLEIIALGDSHTTLAINPNIVKNSFNLAIPSETYTLTEIKVDYLLNNYNKISTYVLPFDIHNFSNYRSGLALDLVYWSNFIPINEFKKYNNKSTIENLIMKNFPFIGNGEQFIENFSTKVDSEIILGWQKNTDNFTETNMESVAKKRINVHYKNYPNYFDNNEYQAFLRILEKLSNSKKNIILIKYPLSKEYISNIEKIGINFTEFYDRINEQELYENYNVKILNYRDIFNENQNFFYDADHLNENGALGLSEKLNGDIEFINKKI